MGNSVITSKTFAIGILLMSSVFLLELATGIMVGTVSYVLITLFVLWFAKTEKMVLILGIFVSLLIVTGYFFRTEEILTIASIRLNRVLTLSGVWLAVYFAIRYRTVTAKEQKLRLQLTALFRNSTEGIVFLNQSGEIILSNPFVEQMFGYKPEDLAGKHIGSILPENRNSGYLNYLTRFLTTHHDGGKSGGFDVHGVTRDGVEFPLEIALSSFSSDNDTTAILFIQDVTNKKERERLTAENFETMSRSKNELEEQVTIRTKKLNEALLYVKKANQELMAEVEARKRIERNLRKSQELHAEIARNFPDGIIGVVDNKMRYIFAEGEELPSFGFDGGNANGRYIFEGMDDRIIKERSDAFQRVYSGEKVKFDINFHDKSYSLTAVPLHGDEQQVDEALVVIKDITKRKKVENDLIVNLEQERTLNMLKSRFVTAASHEFRTPLTTILSSASLLENYEGDQLAAKKEVHLKRIKRSVHGLTDLLNDFLCLGKIEEGKINAVSSMFSMKDMLDQLTSEFDALKKEGQTIVLEYEPGGSHFVSSDRQLIKNILTSLLSNAVKYSAPNSTITLTLRKNSSGLFLEVKDHGIGIPEHEQSHIFERFFRAKNAVDIEGTGLGLNIVRNYVELLDGSIEFRSTENDGTRFMVHVPLAAVPEVVW